MTPQRGRGTSRRDDEGSSLVLALGVVVMVGALASGVGSLVASAARTEAALRAGRDRRLAVEGVLRQAVVAVAGMSPGCSGLSVVGVLDEQPVRVDRVDPCRLVADAAGLHVDRSIRLRACPTELVAGPGEVGDVAALIGTQLTEQSALPPGTLVAPCAGSTIDATIDAGPDVLRSWTEGDA